MSNCTKLIIFDFDGTLFDSAEDIFQCLKILSKTEHSLQNISELRMQEASRYGVVPLIREIIEGTAKQDELYQKFKKLFIKKQLESSSLFSNVLQTLTVLRPKVKMVIWTDKLQEFMSPIVQSYKLEEYFLKIFANESFEQKKPSALPIIKIMEEFKVSAVETLIVGDTEKDLISGKDAGIKTCLALYGYGRAGLREKYQPDYVINSIRELEDIIQ